MFIKFGKAEFNASDKLLVSLAHIASWHILLHPVIVAVVDKFLL